MDDLDFRILNSLQKDSRQSFRDIAKEVDSTPATVISRIEKMEEAGIIKGYTGIFDFSKIGYETMALISLQVDGDRGLRAISQDFSNHPNIIFMGEITGEYDVIILVKFKTREDLKTILKEQLLKKDYIKKVTTSYIEHVHKENMNVPLQ